MRISSDSLRLLVGGQRLGTDYRTATLLGTIQGLSEFLPISSSAHLVAVPWLFGWDKSPLNSLTYDVALHLGTASALLAFFGRDWLRMTMAAARPRTADGRLFWLIALASMPGAVAGYLLDDLASSNLRLPALIAGPLAAMGAVLYLVDSRADGRRSIEELRIRDALAVGVAQAVALIPGVSRSGATLTVGRMRSLDRASAARFSFLLALPITVGAAGFKLRDLDRTTLTGPFFTGIGVSALSGTLAIGLLQRWLGQPTKSFRPFAVYRLGLAALILLVHLRRKTTT
jgi:undecaprenyl-diphosphatase